jgi:hypothetical protein
VDNGTEFTLVPASDEAPFDKPHHRHATRLILRQAAAETAKMQRHPLQVNNSNVVNWQCCHKCSLQRYMAYLFDCYLALQDVCGSSVSPSSFNPGSLWGHQLPALSACS